MCCSEVYTEALSECSRLLSAMDRCVVDGDCDMASLYFGELRLSQTCKDFVSDVLAIDAVAGVKEVPALPSVAQWHSSAATSTAQPAVAQ